MSYSLPREIFISFEETFGKEKAKIIADSLEQSINSIIIETNSSLKANLKDELKNELVTREIFEKENQLIRTEIKSLKTEFDERFKLFDFKLNVLIGIALLSLTFFNPALLTFLTRIFKL